MPNSRLTIIVSGMIAADPWQGGATWAVLQYVLGLRQLGHEVWFVEPLPAKSVRPTGAALGETDNAAYFREVTGAFGLGQTSALLLDGSRQIIGPDYDTLRRA